MKLHLVALLVVLQIHNDQDDNPWKSFVREPSEELHRRCEEEIELSYLSHVRFDSTATFRHLMEDGTLGKVKALAKLGNSNASDLCFQLRRFLRGRPDITEELGVSLGYCFKTNPMKFFELLAKYSALYRNVDCRNLIGNFGEEFVDSPRETLKEAKERLSIMQALPDTLFPVLVRECERVLEDIVEMESKNIKMGR